MLAKQHRRQNRLPLVGWNEFDHLFDQVLTAPGGQPMPIDIYQNEDVLVLEAELPGLKKEDIDLTVENGVLTLVAGQEQKNDEQAGGYHIRERRRGKLSRSFRLPETVDTDKVEAHLADGVLTLRFPTREEAKPRQIEVK